MQPSIVLGVRESMVPQAVHRDWKGKGDRGAPGAVDVRREVPTFITHWLLFLRVAYVPESVMGSGRGAGSSESTEDSQPELGQA